MLDACQITDPVSWKKRVLAIAERNHAALPPWIRAARPSGSGKVWDSVAWQTKADRNVGADEAARPIRLVLSWLNRRDLLTAQGKRLVGAPNEQLALTSALLVPKAAQFLDTHYQRWHDRHGINLIMNASGAASAEEALERLWLQDGEK